MRYIVAVSLLSLALATGGAGVAKKIPATLPTTQPTVEPLQADSILSRMLQPSRTAEPLQPIQEPAAPNANGGFNVVSPKQPAVALRPEGTYIINRLARLSGKSDGFNQLIFDSDGRAMEDPPMRILPNELLASMESQTQSSNDPMAFRVSGLVTQYHGRNYILIDKAVPAPRQIVK